MSTMLALRDGEVVRDRILALEILPEEGQS
jgi:hypothetical protein